MKRLSAFSAIHTVSVSIISLCQATGISSKHVLVAVLPGLPTSAELFILPYQDATGEKKRTAANLEQVSCPLLGEVCVHAFLCLCMYMRYIYLYLYGICVWLELTIMVGMHLIHWGTCYILFRVFFNISVFWRGWLAGLGRFFVFFFPQHWKQALELSLGVWMLICVPLEVLFTTWKQEERRKGLGDDSCQQELWSKVYDTVQSLESTGGQSWVVNLGSSLV